MTDRLDALGRDLDNALARANRAEEVLRDLEPLCPCDPAGNTILDMQQACVIHGDRPAVVADLIAARGFRDQVFDLAAWDRGRRWAYDGVTGRDRPLSDEAADPQDRHYQRQVRRYGEMLSRMMGRLVGFRQARADLADAERERRAERARWAAGGGRSTG